MNRFIPIRFRLLTLTAILALGLTAGAQDLAQRELLPGRGFSIQVPEAFKVTRDAEKGSISCTRPTDRATFEAREVEFHGELSVLAKAASDAMAKQLADFKLIEQSAFEVKSGLKGLKLYLEMRPNKDGPIVRQVLYFFDGRPGYKGFVTCGALAKDDPKLHPLWDRMVGSVVIWWSTDK